MWSQSLDKTDTNCICKWLKFYSSKKTQNISIFCNNHTLQLETSVPLELDVTRHYVIYFFQFLDGKESFILLKFQTIWLFFKQTDNDTLQVNNWFDMNLVTGNFIYIMVCKKEMISLLKQWKNGLILVD